MHTPRHNRILFFLWLLLLFGCGQTPDTTPVILSGSISFSEGVAAGGAPVMVAVTRTLDRRALEEDAKNVVIETVAADPATLTYRIDLTKRGIVAGNAIYLIAFVDCNYTGSIPYPDVGDQIGIYVPKDSLSPAYHVKNGENAGLDIDINRQVYDYSATVTGRITGNDTGKVTIVAFAGEIDSSDFSDIDFADVIGYTVIDKGVAPAAYTLDILPYGRRLPIENLQVFALLDADADDRISAGDKIGAYRQNDTAFVSLIPLETPGTTAGIDIGFFYNVPTPSGYDMSIAGAFTLPSGYFDTSAPVYIALFATDQPDDFIKDPLGSLKYFYRLPKDDFFFDRDLSKTGLVPGDRLLAVAFWDRDNAGGLPLPTPGDKLGIVQNKRTYQYRVTLGYGKTILPPEDYEWKINKRLYDFSAGIDYAIDMSHAGSYDAEKARIILLLIHVDGLSFAIKPFSGSFDFSIDMDYLLGVRVLPAGPGDYIGIGDRTDPAPPRSFPVLTALYDQIVVWAENAPPDPLIKGHDHGTESEQTAYLVAILDKNGNGELDADDEIGYYSNTTVTISAENNTIELPVIGQIVIPPQLYGTFQLPTPIERITRGENREQRTDGSLGPYWIIMNPAFDPLNTGG